MKSKDLEVLVGEIREEIDKNEKHIRNCQEKNEFEQVNTATGYIKYHNEMIKFIKKVDNGLINQQGDRS